MEAWLRQWINLTDYSLAQLAVVGVGTSLWGVAYLAIIYNSFRKRFVEMPAFVACGNLGWEFVWGFVFHPNMGPLVVHLYQMCFVLDTLIFYNLLRYGHKQVDVPELRRAWKPLCVAMFILSAITCYFFPAAGYDDVLGATSAYILQVLISVQYITLFFRVRNRSLYSVVGTWARRLGTAIITVGMFMIYPQNHFLQYVGIVCMVLDGIFVALLHISAFGALISRWEPPAPLRTAPVKSLPFGEPDKPVARLGWRA